MDDIGLRPLRHGLRPLRGTGIFSEPTGSDRFDVQSEQRHASETGTLPEAVVDELALLDRADLLVLQYPMWWHLPPAMLKGWFDRVLTYGEGYTSRKRWEAGRFVGKRAMLSVTVGTSRETYAFDGRSGDIDLMLWPVNFSLAYVGYDVPTPFVAYGVEAGLRYSDPEVVEKRLKEIVEDFRAELPLAPGRATIPFNRMDEWDRTGGKAGSPRAFPFHSAKAKSRTGMSRRGPTPASAAGGGVERHRPDFVRTAAAFKGRPGQLPRRAWPECQVELRVT